MRILLNDPPRQKTEDRGQRSEVFVELDELLHESNIVTMHVPLTDNNGHPTLQMANNEFFHKMRPGTIFINSSRGAVMNTDALLTSMDEGLVSHAIIDTWEDEPNISQDLLDHADIGTPHIAGYSFDGKVEGTVMVYREACEFLGQDPIWTPDALLPEPAVPEINIDASGMTDEEALWKIVQQVYNVQIDDTALRANPKNFDQLRRDYHTRREFRFTKVNAQNASDKLLAKISAIGFAR
jgi:erythronate-4-phosphate dehydrogenase